MTTLLMPQRAFFGFSASCRYRAEAPKIDGNLRDWDADHLLPDLMGVEGAGSFAEVYAAWNDDGFYIGLKVTRKTQYKIVPKDFWTGDCLEVWLDTRDLKDTHRANRYCHHFYFLPGGSGTDGKKPIGRQAGIDPAREQAPPCPEESIRVGLRRLKTSYSLEVALPAEGLNGFQPREFGRLGFNYALHDTQRGRQSWTVSRDRPQAVCPNAWGTLELEAGSAGSDD